MKFSKYFLFIAAFIVVANPSNLLSQLHGQAKIDSLTKVLKKTKNDTLQVVLLNKLADVYIDISPEKAVESSNKALKLAQEIDWLKGEADSYNKIGISYTFGFSDSKTGIEYSLKALNMYKKIGNDSLLIRTLTNIGSGYLGLGKFSKALEYYYQSLKKSEKLNDSLITANNLMNIGIVNYNIEKYKEASEYFEKSYEIYLRLNKKSNVSLCLLNLANVYSYLGDTQKSIEYNKKALTLSKEIDDKATQSYIYTNLGRHYQEQYNFTKAEENFNHALSIAEELNNSQTISYSLRSLGGLYLEASQDTIRNKFKTKESISWLLNKESNLNKSIDYNKRAESICLKVGDIRSLVFVYNDLYTAYYEKDDAAMALKYFQEHVSVRDSLFHIDRLQQIADIEKAGEDDVNKIKLEKQQIQLAAQESERDFIIMIAVGIVTSIVIILIIIYTQRKKSDKLLYNVLPISIAKRLKKKEHPISDNFAQASIIFIDIVGFTAMSKDSDPTDIVQALNKIFTHYDSIARKHGLEKIKTIGDCYMAAAGLPVVQEDNTYRAAKMALEVRDYMVDYTTDHGYKLDVRIGLDCGPVVAGVIGEQKFIYDMWSDAVNTASRMESTGQPGQVHISEKFKDAVNEFHEFKYIERDEIEVKGKGKMKTFFIEN